MTRLAYLPLVAVLFSVPAASAQDNKPSDFESYAAVKDTVRRVTMQHGYTGWDDKILSRAGDLAAIAIAKSIPESELTSAPTMKDVLWILHTAFACPSRCIADSANRRPEVAMLFLEHLRNRTVGSMQSDVDETRDYIKQQTRDVE